MRYIWLSVVFFWQSGFVLLSGTDEAKLNVSPEAPQVTFVWNGSYPPLKDVAKWRSDYVVTSDTQTMRDLLSQALATWTQVPQAYIQLVLAENEEAGVDPKDNVHSIVVKKFDALTAAAFAKPTYEDGVISDCDITVAKNSVSVKSLLYTLTHEIGHCLGLGHAHLNYRALMGYSRNPGDARLGADDMAGLIYLYPDPSYDQDVAPLTCGSVGTLTSRGAPLWFFLAPFSLLFYRMRQRRKIS